MNFNEVFQTIERGICDVYDSKRYRQYLRVMSRFPSYSLNNTILIFSQKPDATLVAGYQAWRTKFHRNVRRGEKGIRILAPVSTRRKTDTEEEEPVKPATCFRAVSVFDISQTEGEPLPVYMEETLEGSVDDYEDFLEVLEMCAPVPVRFASISGNARGYFNARRQEIVLRKGMTQLQTIKTLVHEIAHSMMHQGDDADLSRRQKEIEAESVAYILCSHYGLDTGSYSFGYLAGYSSSRDMPELRASMERIHTASSVLISKIDLMRMPEKDPLMEFRIMRDDSLYA